MVNVIFNQVLFVQFFASILVLCTSVYYLSIHIRNFSGILPFLVYTIGMFVQIYIYCWSGNEVILKVTILYKLIVYLIVNDIKEIVVNILHLNLLQNFKK